MSLAPRLGRLLEEVAATDGFPVGLAADDDDDVRILHSLKVAGHCAEPTPSSNAATEEAWQSRVQ